jgi:RHS repeat-associated protein
MNSMSQRKRIRSIIPALVGLTCIVHSAGFPAQTEVSLTRAPEAATAQTRFDYDSLGNLRGVLLPDGTRVEYTVDGANRRTGKKVNGTFVQRFLYDGAIQVAAELDGEGQLVSRFIYGSRGHVPDYLVRGGRQLRLIADQLGSVRLVVDCQTGEVAQRLDYDAFGVIVQDTNPGFQPFGFAGGLYDRHTGLTRFGARDYDAETGRWTSRDPILFAAGQANLYTYVLNDPVNALDPFGLQSDQGASSSSAPQATGAGINGRPTGWHPIFHKISDYFANPPVTGPAPYTREWAGEPSSPPMYCPRGPDRPPRQPGDIDRREERKQREARQGRPAPELNESNFPTRDINVEAEETADTAIAIRG